MPIWLRTLGRFTLSDDKVLRLFANRYADFSWFTIVQ